MRTIRLVAAFWGRICLTIIFLMSGVKQLFSWPETEQTLMEALGNWQSYVSFSQPMQQGITTLIPWTPVLLAVAVLFQLLGGLMVLCGYRDRMGAILLILFILPATLLFHAFWFMEDGSSRDLQTIMFLKNLSMLGGLIFVALHGVKMRGHSDMSSMELS